MVAVLNTNEIYERESRRFANLRNINSPVQFRPSRVVVKHSLARSRDEQRARLFIFLFFRCPFPAKFSSENLIDDFRSRFSSSTNRDTVLFRVQLLRNCTSRNAVKNHLALLQMTSEQRW